MGLTARSGDVWCGQFGPSGLDRGYRGRDGVMVLALSRGLLSVLSRVLLSRFSLPIEADELGQELIVLTKGFLVGLSHRSYRLLGGLCHSLRHFP